MQKWLVKRPHNPLDMLCEWSVTVNGNIASDRFLLDIDVTIDEEKYDFVVMSAHDPNAFSNKRKNKLVLVVSYIPEMSNQDEWPSFYVNLCMCDVIAGSTAILTRIKTTSLPEKLYVNLDGCAPIKPWKKTKAFPDKKFFFSLDRENNDVWKTFTRYVGHKIRVSERDGTEYIFEISNEPVRHGIGIAFNNVCPVLATFWSHRYRFISVPNDDYSYLLPVTFTNAYGSKLQRMLSGAAAEQYYASIFEPFLEELASLINYADNKEIRFYSNQTIYERIFVEVNRAK